MKYTGVAVGGPLHGEYCSAESRRLEVLKPARISLQEVDLINPTAIDFTKGYYTFESHNHGYFWVWKGWGDGSS